MLIFSVRDQDFEELFKLYLPIAILTIDFPDHVIDILPAGGKAQTDERLFKFVGTDTPRSIIVKLHKRFF